MMKEIARDSDNFQRSYIKGPKEMINIQNWWSLKSEVLFFFDIVAEETKNLLEKKKAASK